MPSGRQAERAQQQRSKLSSSYAVWPPKQRIKDDNEVRLWTNKLAQSRTGRGDSDGKTAKDSSLGTRYVSLNRAGVVCRRHQGWVCQVGKCDQHGHSGRLSEEAVVHLQAEQRLCHGVWGFHCVAGCSMQSRLRSSRGSERAASQGGHFNPEETQTKWLARAVGLCGPLHPRKRPVQRSPLHADGHPGDSWRRVVRNRGPVGGRCLAARGRGCHSRAELFGRSLESCICAKEGNVFFPWD
ncbi:hypothetical protein BKA66DRAFT_21901 [Pyrenochaeta sp. MPI-SDFR-AT-0127]|nr:hypothetical protein BKA66DRAFT_21901 [Pyrenochaeta sp. MPI-SDFR-AT-0127]